MSNGSAGKSMRRVTIGERAAKLERLELSQALAALKRAAAADRDLEDAFEADGYMPPPELAAEHRRLAVELAELAEVMRRRTA
jgi:hypothetical protein